MSGAATALRVLRDEGVRAAGDRLRDRLIEWRRHRRFAEGPVTVRTPVLNVLAVPPHAREGGVAIQAARRLEEESAIRACAWLYRTPGGYRLEATAGRTFQTQTLRLFGDSGFEEAVTAAARTVGAGVLHFEGLAGLPLRSVARLRRVGRLVVSVHDFALFCVRPHLVQKPEDVFCDYCLDLARCARCLVASWRVPAGFQAAYRGAGRALVNEVDALVFPSRFLQERHAQLFDVPQAVLQRVIAPASFSAPAPGVSSPDPRHVALVGAVHTHKGAGVFEEVVGLLQAKGRRDLRWSVWGGGDPLWLTRLRALPAVDVRGYYRSGSLAVRLRQQQVGLALLLSTVPEAYGLTLDECWSAGVPVIAFDHGAMADRIRESGGGRLVPLPGGAAGVAAAIEEIEDGGAASALRAAAARYRGSDPASAARAYAALYTELA